MLNRFKNLKIVKTLKQQISPKLRWLNFMNHNIDKSSPDYVRLISGVDELKSSSDERKHVSWKQWSENNSKKNSRISRI